MNLDDRPTPETDAALKSKGTFASVARGENLKSLKWYSRCVELTNERDKAIAERDALREALTQLLSAAGVFHILPDLLAETDHITMEFSGDKLFALDKAVWQACSALAAIEPKQ